MQVPETRTPSGSLCQLHTLFSSRVFAAFSTTGFDRLSSPVFNPADPESSVEDCLAAAGDRVAKELDTRLAEAVGELLAGSVHINCV